MFKLRVYDALNLSILSKIDGIAEHVEGILSLVAHLLSMVEYRTKTGLVCSFQKSISGVN